jgi:peptidoglycan/LPS O-acetylase OafA/YrhL
MQGVRALAVAAVFLYHVEPAFLPGGFLGVDIFFVVSGFLIGRKLLTELDETGSIAILSFGAQRAKRLLPNATLALIISALATYIFLPTYRLHSISEDILSAALFYSNIHFAYNAIDYLQIGEPPSPLLHFWSLSIEEQFYVGLPILFALIAMLYPTRRISFAVCAVIAVAVASFLLGLQALQTSKPDAFFLTHNRIWQLAIGVIAGWAAVKSASSLSKSISSLLLFASATVLLCCIFFISAEYRYPGFLALLPTLATALFLVSLASVNHTILHRVLSVQAAQWFGDRSYSIYLWHWPFIAISAELAPGSVAATAFAGAVSLGAASLAFTHVEQPVRRYRTRSAAYVLTLAACTILVVVVSSALLSSLPIPGDAKYRAEQIQAARKDLGAAYESKCHLDILTIKAADCDFGEIQNRRSLMLFGDSHAAQWSTPLRDAAIISGWRFRSRTKTSCPAPDILMWYPPKASVYEECTTWRATVMKELRSEPPTVLVLANNTAYSGWIAENGTPVSDKRGAEIWKAAFDRLMQEVPANTEIWLIRDTPRMFTNILTCLSYSDDCKRPRGDATSQLIDETEMATRAGRKIKIFDFTDQLCDQRFCPAVINEMIVYRDSHHITSTFAGRFMEEFRAGISMIN